MRSGQLFILLIAGLVLVECIEAHADPRRRAREPAVKSNIVGTAQVGRLPKHIALQSVQERPSLDKDFYDNAGFEKFETKAEGPVPNSRASWPSLEQEREEAMNQHGWFDPRVSQGWKAKDADKQAPKPKPSADANKPIQPLDQQFYEDAGFPKYQLKAEEGASAKRGEAIPSLEEQREEVFNKAGWFDPRYSRRWESIKAMSGKPKKVSA